MHQFEKFECNSPHTPPPPPTPSPPPLTKMIILDICLSPKLFYQSIANNRFVGTNTGKITTELFFAPSSQTLFHRLIMLHPRISLMWGNKCHEC